MSRFNSNHNRQYGPGEINHLPSLTVPDQAMSIREIIDRFSRGLPLDAERMAVYHGEDFEVPDFTGWDLAQIQEYREQLTERNNIARAKITADYDAATQKKREEAAKKAADQKKFQKWLASQDQPDNPA